MALFSPHLPAVPAAFVFVLVVGGVAQVSQLPVERWQEERSVALDGGVAAREQMQPEDLNVGLWHPAARSCSRAALEALATESTTTLLQPVGVDRGAELSSGGHLLDLIAHPQVHVFSRAGCLAQQQHRAESLRDAPALRSRPAPLPRATTTPLCAGSWTGWLSRPDSRCLQPGSLRSLTAFASPVAGGVFTGIDRPAGPSFEAASLCFLALLCAVSHSRCSGLAGGWRTRDLQHKQHQI